MFSDSLTGGRESGESVATSMPFEANSPPQVRTLAPGSLLAGRLPAGIYVEGRLLVVWWPEQQAAGF